MKNKRFILLKSTAFLVILFVILSLLSNLFTPKSITENTADEPSNTLDYIAIGDSECRTSISPMELWKTYGYAGYNCGVNAQQIQDTYYKLEKVLQRQSPKVVLLETNLLYRTQGYKRVIERSIDYFFCKTFSLYEYHDEWKKLIFRKADVKNVRNENNLFKGWYYSTAVVPYKSGPYINETADIQKIGAIQLFYLDKIVELCKGRGIQMILYCVPSPINWNYLRHNAVAKYAEGKHLPFLDLNLKTDELAIDWKHDTPDKGDHLNLFGAIKVTSYIGKYFCHNTELTDHRNDKNYAAWNEKLRDYLVATAQTLNSFKLINILDKSDEAKYRLF